MANQRTKTPLAEEANYSEIAYRHLRDIPGYSKEALNVTFFYIKIEDYMGTGNDAYIRCTKEQFYAWRNAERNAEREEYEYNEHIGNFTISMDQEREDENGEVTIIEYEDKESVSPEDQAYINETIEKAKSLAKDVIDLKILECLLDGVKSDLEIGKIVGLGRSATQERRAKLQKRLKEEMADYIKGLKEQESRRTCTYGKKKY